jgi:AcrR family transcriptional regulator
VAEEQQSTPAPRAQRGRPRLTEPSPEFIRRRDEIIETAARVFHARGYEAGSLDDVAAELDLRKASLYYYVDSKAQLLYWIFDRAITLALKRLDELSEITDPAERLGAFIAHQVSIVAEERSLFTVFFESRPRLDSDYEEEIRRKERRYLHRFVDAVANAVEAGVLPPIDPRHGAQAILGMSSWVYKWFDPADSEWGRVADDFNQLVLRVRVPVEALSSADVVRPS